MASKGSRFTLEQCRARHGQDLSLRCAVTYRSVPENVQPPGHEHWAIDTDGQTVRWMDIVAAWPEIDSPLYAAAVRAELADVPDRTQVGNGSARLNQVGGEHYRKFKIQPWDVIDEYGLSFYAGNALKYLLRAGNKGAKVEDLKKCRHYLDKLIEVEEARSGG